MSHLPRAVLSLLPAWLLALAGLAGPAPAVAQAAAPGSASASLLSCQAAADQADRSATFAGQMSATASSSTMAIRIDLLARIGSANGFVRVSAPGLGVWQQSAAGIQVYKYVRLVTNLPAPARYRAAISYRWLDARGRVVRRATRLTPVCKQPDERPLLVVGAVSIAPSASALDAQYAIALRNDGRGPAGPIDVSLAVNGVAQPDLVVQSLAPGARTVLQVVAPRCTPGSAVTVRVDPQGTIAEAPGGGLPKTVACPLAAASRSARG